ncbi:GntR family transcriptional regulator [Martelella endophytica]|uniref:Phage tail protein n=1 Tax=Martelella endophytica TaxID=1486262 RepID=A0A0D5LMY1_MAREN|nr:GntR family transcriptional regulator [Martelella endophytica]AJY45486.1 phage tail protein [Martelella endophytica]
MDAFFQKLDLDGDGPLYLRLKAALAEAIASGRLKPGAALPAERDMAAALGISRVTVRRAIEELTREERIERRQGAGTFVAEPLTRIEQSLSRLTSFSDDMARRGLKPGSRWITRGLFKPSTEEVMALGLSPGARVARLVRVRLADDRAMALERSSLPEDILAAPEIVETSLYDVLADAGVQPARAIERISACCLSEAESLLLGMAIGAPALTVERLAYNGAGRVIEVTRTLYRADVFDMVAEMTF